LEKVNKRQITAKNAYAYLLKLAYLFIIVGLQEYIERNFSIS